MNRQAMKSVDARNMRVFLDALSGWIHKVRRGPMPDEATARELMDAFQHYTDMASRVSSVRRFLKMHALPPKAKHPPSSVDVPSVEQDMR